MLAYPTKQQIQQTTYENNSASSFFISFLAAPVPFGQHSTGRVGEWPFFLQSGQTRWCKKRVPCPSQSSRRQPSVYIQCGLFPFSLFFFFVSLSLSFALFFFFWRLRFRYRPKISCTRLAPDTYSPQQLLPGSNASSRPTPTGDCQGCGRSRPKGCSASALTR